MPFPRNYLLDPEFHALPIEERQKRVSKADPEFASFPESKRRTILDNAAKRYGRKQPEGVVESARKDLSIGFRAGESELGRSVASIAGLVPGLSGVSEKAREFSRSVAPKPEETEGRSGVFSQVMQGVGAAPPTIAKYAGAELAGKYAPIAAGLIGGLSKADQGFEEALKEGVKDVATFGLLGKAGRLPSRGERAVASAVAAGGTSAAFEGGDIKKGTAAAIMGGAFGAASRTKKESFITPEDARVALEKGKLFAFEKLVDPVKKSIAPQTRGPAAKKQALITRSKVSEIARQSDVAEYALREASQYFRLKPDAERLRVIAAIEKPGTKLLNPQEQKFVETMREIHAQVRDELIHEASRIDPKTGKLEPTVMRDVADAIANPDKAERAYYINYFPHLFKDPKGAAELMQAYYAGKRPLRGPATFLKQRYHPTIEDALKIVNPETGKPRLELVTTDPVEAYMLKWREMKRFTAAQKIIKEMHTENLLQFVPSGKRGPKDWVEVRDNAFRRSVRLNDGSLRIVGSFYAPEPAARVLNNYLSPGIRSAPGMMGEAFRGMMQFNNVLNQAQLGFSAFHLGFTSVDAVTSRFALGLEQVAEGMRSGKPGMVGKGVVGLVKGTPIGAPVALAENIKLGRKMMREWRSPGSSGDPEMARLVSMMQQAGGGMSLDPIYRTTMTKKVYETFRQQQHYWTLLYRAPLMLNEKFAMLIMNKFVPMQKLGVFADLARFELERLPKGAPEMQVRDVMAKAWDSVDNRMGMLRYDNLFWEKWIKDMSMLTVRSVGWNLGTLRELGGGMHDWTKLMKSGHKEFSHRMAYTLAMPAVTGMMGGMIHWMYNGKIPETIMDWYFPRTGRKDEFGRDERLSIPSYVKDVYHIATRPGATAVAKIHSSWAVIADMLMNRDFYNTEIANRDDPFMKKIIDYTGFLLKSYDPFSFTNIKREQDLGFPVSEQVGTFFGFIPAPADIKKTPAERLATEIMAESLPKRPSTREERDRQVKRRELERRIRINDNWQEFARSGIRDGSLSEHDVEYSVDRASGLPLDRSFRRMRIQDAVRVYRSANAEEKNRLRPILDDKVRHNSDKIEAMPEKQRDKLMKDLMEILSEGGAAPPPA